MGTWVPKRGCAVLGKELAENRISVSCPGFGTPGLNSAVNTKASWRVVHTRTGGGSVFAAFSVCVAVASWDVGGGSANGADSAAMAVAVGAATISIVMAIVAAIVTGAGAGAVVNVETVGDAADDHRPTREIARERRLLPSRESWCESWCECWCECWCEYEWGTCMRVLLGMKAQRRRRFGVATSPLAASPCP
ncbi:MAG: hypothetical protein IPK13_00780 [Deltaproteobacteria bacterium]|nr:hypothetical protein [Deltaproteobacteria bacterium]